jgi:hypothetical protein
LQRNGPVSKQSPLWSETPTASECSANDGLGSRSSPTFALWGTPRAADGMAHPLRPGATVENSRSRLEDQVAVASLSSPVGSLANLIPLQENVRRLLTIVTSGPRLPVSFARFDRDGSSGRMFPVSSTANLDGSLAAFSGTWPTWGIALDGACGELPTLERCTAANESSSSPIWQTPVADDSVDRLAGKWNSRGEPKLSAQVKSWPTPRTADAKGQGMSRTRADKPDNLSAQLGGSLNPMWVEWLMGFPLGWTALEPSETPSSRIKPIRSSPKSPESKG